MGLKDWWARVTGRAEPEPDPGSDADDELAAAPTEADIAAALQRVRTLATQGAVPAAVMSRLSRIDTTITQTLPRLRNLGFGSLDAYAVVATATDYLPEALSGYLRLPRDWADSRPIENGKSSLLLLIDQLDLLGATMDRIFDAVCREDARALIENGRFLAEKFGTASSGGQLDLTAGGASTPPPEPGSVQRLSAPGSTMGPPRSAPVEPPRPRSTLDLEDE